MVTNGSIPAQKPRRAWCAIIGGWTSEEKQEYIKERGLPVSEAYLVLGFSGECTACSFDETGLLTNIDLLCPELGYAIRSLTVWLYQRMKRGDVDLAPKRLCWGWQPGESLQSDFKKPEQKYHTFEAELVDDGVENGLQERPAKYDVEMVTKTMVGCDEESCATRERPDWILDLPDSQIVTRSDVKAYWESGQTPRRFPL